jgi:hypothetical protein
MHLGLVLTPYGQIPGAPPWEIGYSYGGDGTFLCPDDPYQNQRGEAGFYHDSQLGGPPFKPKSLIAAGIAPQPHLPQLSKLAQRRVRRALNGLGRAIPTDFDLAPTYGYVPMMDGWVAAKEGFQPGGWIPPNAYNPAGAYGAGLVPRGLGDAVPTDVPSQAALVDVIASMQQRNNKLFVVSLISAAAVTISAIVTTIRNAHLIKQERRLLAEEGAF